MSCTGLIIADGDREFVTARLEWKKLVMQNRRMEIP